MTIEPSLERRIVDSRVETAGGLVPALPPDAQRKWITALTNTAHNVQQLGHMPVILCSEAARPLVKASARREIPDLAVLSVPEIVPDVRIEALAEIRIEE
jgi:flagellar biosynthesis protein FlhA